MALGGGTVLGVWGQRHVTYPLNSGLVSGFRHGEQARIEWATGLAICGGVGCMGVQEGFSPMMSPAHEKGPGGGRPGGCCCRGPARVALHGTSKPSGHRQVCILVDSGFGGSAGSKWQGSLFEGDSFCHPHAVTFLWSRGVMFQATVPSSVESSMAWGLRAKPHVHSSLRPWSSWHSVLA